MSDYLQLPQVPSHPPADEQQLLTRACALAGMPLGWLAEQAGWVTPDNLSRAKGWSGQLIELYLGASAGSRPEQDFPELGIELKTIPVNSGGTPLETTYVCIAPLLGLNGVSWQQSNVRNKLQKVLWVPLDGRREIKPADRCIGMPFLWQPAADEDALLRADWEEITERIILGQIQQITARHGQALQLRPKAANSKALTAAIGPDGDTIQTLPRGYYLKTDFTARILQRALQNSW
ncbi:DNA mismatch repair endonuclease MutH [Aliidiomarina sedimenti]|uniref:DNA mismatch repair protein MutH n=1 Tax=Aliidiomarina sedimenti TaxID=1933879 RepID=A0ABY0BZ48_9GAMM|nr:DNA mismatch repair endonuclease MutH [Aliidiomarina sedimenti]RUO29818.1 DNA mismatch repair endonuclease MutH [Aliidiomarina sedimenti]